MRHIFTAISFLAPALLPPTALPRQATSPLEQHSQQPASQSTNAIGDLPLSQLQKLADAGDPAAQNELGVRYRMGTGVEKNPATAVGWYMKAAQQGYGKAYFNLGAAYYNGDGVAINDEASCTWFVLAADAGDSRSQEAIARVLSEKGPTRLAQCEAIAANAYLLGKLIKQDVARAFQLYGKAASAGDPVACERLANLYGRGLGVPPDKQQALLWLQRSAELKYPPAIYELGWAYETGNWVPVDIVKARKLYEQAALMGQPAAMVALGKIYSAGKGIKLDSQRALVYYLEAAAYGNAEGKSLAETLESQLSPKQVAQAKLDAAHFIQTTSRSPLLIVRQK